MSSSSRSSSPATQDPSLAPIRALLDHLSTAGVREIGRALHARLNVPPTAADRRVAELRYLTSLLEERPQYPERLPYVPRTVYDGRRASEARAAPPSARLTERYGSWPRACRAAWGLLEDGRFFGDTFPWPQQRRGATYSRDEAAAALHECATQLSRIPSSHDYNIWTINRRARARASGEPVRIPCTGTVLRLFAADRSNRNGWRLVLARVFSHSQSARPEIAHAKQNHHGADE
jgi:hypothetical protein